jgi:hypothetical protein
MGIGAKKLADKELPKRKNTGFFGRLFGGFGCCAER